MPEIAIVIAAGGDARRLPGKLERSIGGTPLLAVVYGNMRGGYPVRISARATFARDLDERLDCPIVIDRWEGRGPLGGLLTTFGAIDSARVFVVAGDAPAVTREVIATLAAAWQPGDEAAVPEHDGQIEPLAALYDRLAFLRVGWAAMERGEYALHAVAGRMRARHVLLSRHFFENVNTAADLARIAARTSKGIV